MGILLTLLVFIIILGLVIYLIRILPIDYQFKNIAYIIVIIIAIVYLITRTGL